MRHIKTYKVFEEIGKYGIPCEIHEYLDDITQDLKDEGYKIDISEEDVRLFLRKRHYIIVDFILPKHKDGLLTHDLYIIQHSHIKDNIDMMISYMESEGYSCLQYYWNNIEGWMEINKRQDGTMLRKFRIKFYKK